MALSVRGSDALAAAGGLLVALANVSPDYSGDEALWIGWLLVSLWGEVRLYRLLCQAQDANLTRTEDILEALGAPAPKGGTEASEDRTD